MEMTPSNLTELLGVRQPCPVSMSLTMINIVPKSHFCAEILVKLQPESITLQYTSLNCSINNSKTTAG